MRAAHAVTADIKHDAILKLCDKEIILKQISKAEISELMTFMLGPEAQNRLATLPMGVCTRFDKHTLAARNTTMLAGFNASYKQKPLIPRTIIGMRVNETTTVAYILLGCKLANAYSKNEFEASKKLGFKISGSFKHKTNVLCISISDNINEIAVDIKAMIKMKKGIKNFIHFLKMSLHGAIMQHTLAQHCDEIMDCVPLELDATFAEHDLYVISELGRELFELIWNYELKNPLEKISIAKDICRALCFLHRLKIAHRDIKPENAIIVTSKRAKLIDFDFIDESGKSNNVCGTKYLLPFYYLHKREDNPAASAKHYVPSFQLNVEEKKSLYKACISGSILCDIWSFGILLFDIHSSVDFDTVDGQKILKAYKNSANIVEQTIYQILCPARDNCYLLTVDQQLEQDLDKPLAQRTYLSMEKLYHQLFNEEYMLDEGVVKELQPRMQKLIAARPTLTS